MAAKKSNGYDPDQIESYVSRIVNLKDDAASDTGKIRRTLQTDMNEVYEDATDQGIPKKHLKLKIAELLLKRKQDKIRAELEPEDQQIFDQISLALGEEYALEVMGLKD